MNKSGKYELPRYYIELLEGFIADRDKDSKEPNSSEFLRGYFEGKRDGYQRVLESLVDGNKIETE